MRVGVTGESGSVTGESGSVTGMRGSVTGESGSVTGASGSDWCEGSVTHGYEWKCGVVIWNNYFVCHCRYMIMKPPPPPPHTHTHTALHHPTGIPPRRHTQL